MKISRFAILAVLLAFAPGLWAANEDKDRPNIVLIYGDDMGIDSVSEFNEKMGLEMPNIDRLASEGFSFMDAHTTSAVCTPSRYGLLTGRYNWRSRLKSGIVGKWERPLIEEGRLTLPAMLKAHGYQTTMIGKWHLGFHWPKQGGGHTEKQAEIDFSAAITGGPNHRGFDYWFGDDVPNWPPYAWRENDKLLGKISTTAKAIGITSYVGVGDGPAVADWSLEAVLPEYAKRCSEFIRKRTDQDEPFFLYFPMPSPHTPIAPDENWKGKSGISDYADFLLETDWAVGEVLKALDESGQAENTLVIFSTDNGTSPKADFAGLDSKGVHLAEHWRGYKADAFEGGHRVPFIVRWPGKVAAGSRSDELVSLVDVMATVADVVGHKLPATAAEDSVSLLPILRGEKPSQVLHEAVVCHSISGYFALRSGKWKILFCQGSGGWSGPREPEAAKAQLPAIQLYDLEADPKETTNLYEKHPEVVSDLTAVLRRYIENGRSTPGAKQQNHAGAVYWKNVPWEKPAAVAPAAKSTTAQSAVSISTPQNPELFSHRVVTLNGAIPENRKVSLPTPFPNIVRAWTPSSESALRWTFNKDASEILLDLPNKEGSPVHVVTAEKSERQGDGLIVLSALDSAVVGEKAKLETHPGNHRIGFWANGDDYVTWDLEDLAVDAGSYDVELVYSRAGAPGAEASVAINGKSIPVTLQPTGSWYVYQVQPLGKIDLESSASLAVEVRSVKQKGAVMNLKAVLLRPQG
jgi:arylsulfatase A-like enzyme